MLQINPDMDIQHILRADYLDIIFDRHNKRYGGYELRRTYPQRIRKALLSVVFGVGVVSALPVIAAHMGRHNDDIAVVSKKPIDVHTLIFPTPPKPDVPLPPEHLSAPPVHVNTQEFRQLVVARNEDVEKPPTPVDSLAGKQIAVITSTNGKAFDGSIADDVIDDGNGKAGGHDLVENPGPHKIFKYVEQMPVFNGDVNQWLGRHTQYPDAARENGIAGRVIVQFVVNEDGSVSNAEAVKKASPALDAEAIRVVSAMPKWKPGKQNGIPVKVYFTLPVTFQLD